MAFSVAQNDAYHAGTDHTMDFTLSGSGDITGATPINWEIRKHVLNPATVLAKTGTVEDGPNRVIRVQLSSSDAPAAGVYAMQVDMTLSSEESVVAQGSFEVKTKITS